MGETVTQETRNGIMVRDKKTGRLVKGTRPANMITPENSRSLGLARQEKKRAVIRAAANAAVERGDFVHQYGDDAFIAEIAANMQAKATTLDDPKAVDAARFLLQETGIAESKQAQDAAGGSVADLFASVPPGGLVMLVRRMRDAQSVDIMDIISNDDTPSTGDGRGGDGAG